MKRAMVVVVTALAPVVAFVACKNEPTIQRDGTCPSVGAPTGVEPGHHDGHTTHHACTAFRDEANRALRDAVEAADSHCSKLADCVPLPIPSDCGLWGTCVPKYVSKSERRSFDVIAQIRAGACASWTKTGCDDYVDDPPACSYSSTPVCAKGTCSVEVMAVPSASSSGP